MKVVWLLNIVMREDTYSTSGGNDKKTNNKETIENFC